MRIEIWNCVKNLLFALHEKSVLHGRFLTGAIEEVSESTGVSRLFLGLIVLPIAGNAAEHITAVFVAAKDKMDLAIAVALGSSIQARCVLDSCEIIAMGSCERPPRLLCLCNVSLIDSCCNDMDTRGIGKWCSVPVGAAASCMTGCRAVGRSWMGGRTARLCSAVSALRPGEGIKGWQLLACAQIAIFVLPVVCLVGWATKHAFTLDLDPLSIIILTLSVIHACVTSSASV